MNWRHDQFVQYSDVHLKSDLRQVAEEYRISHKVELESAQRRILFNMSRGIKDTRGELCEGNGTLMGLDVERRVNPFSSSSPKCFTQMSVPKHSRASSP